MNRSGNNGIISEAKGEQKETLWACIYKQGQQFQRENRERERESKNDVICFPVITFMRPRLRG